MSPRSPSLSEGEVSSGDGEKVAKNASHAASTRINTSPRLQSSSRSSRPSGRDALMSDRNAHFNGYSGDTRDRSRSPFRRDRDRSHRDRDCDGSRSPYRAEIDAGRDKRRRQDDHYGKSASDPRRHKVHEDRTSHRNRYRDPDRPEPASPAHPHDDTRGVGRGSGRGSTRDTYGRRDHDRSRSPYRGPSTNGHHLPSSSHAGPRSDVRDGTQSAHRESTPKASSREVDTKKESSSSEQSARPFGAAVQTRSVSTKETAARADTDRCDSSTAAEQPAEPPRQLSEAELIEQRRKKREAIRKRHAAASTNDSLLRATLESTLPSAATTPYNESSLHGSEPQSPPSSINSPQTPRDVSTPGSPAAIDDADLVNPIQLDAANEGQSAADYDPNQDMDEDRPDHKRQEVHDTATHDDHTKDVAGSATPPLKKAAVDFDMFADDDDDMFAADNAPVQKGTTQQARALDESLLDNWDYPDGHYRIIHGELLDGRYAVEQQIGKGTFATVVRARDSESGKKVAIKIACRNDTMLKAGQKEMQFLNRLNESDPEDKKFIIRLLADFTHKGHLCLVFEGLEMDLRETLKKFGRDVGINPEAIQIYARQMFLALLHMKNSEVLHADLKPDNILVSSDNKMIKIIDFGTATLQQDAELTPYLVSRFYRAPEVILGMDFDYAIDMWSIGCTLYELYTGRILFNGSDNNSMLRVIQECRGKLPNRLIRRAKLADKYFDEAFVFHGLERDKMTGNIVHRPMHFSQGVTGKDLKSRLGANAKKMDTTQLRLHSAFVDLLDKCLQLDPEKRIKPKDALRHPFLGDMKRDVLSQAKAKSNVASSTKAFRPAVVQRSG